jgi:DNA-binding response OmpR family regulator
MTQNNRVVIIDDDEFIRFVLKKALTADGYDVHEAVDGEEGLEKIKSALPALIICDRMMPRMSGVEVLRHLQETEFKGVPFVFLTALSDIRDKLAVCDLPVSEYLEKPFTPEILRACVKRVLGGA